MAEKPGEGTRKPRDDEASDDAERPGEGSRKARPEAGRGGGTQPSESRRGGEYARTTRGVRVCVRSFYLEDQSQPEDGNYVWAYRVRIENHGRLPVQLLRRTWHITDARGRTQHVHGEGVVGEQPLLEPGEAFEYTSGTPLETPSGFMHGLYHMIAPDSGEAFDVEIPPFSLDSPHGTGRVH